MFVFQPTNTTNGVTWDKIEGNLRNMIGDGLTIAEFGQLGLPVGVVYTIIYGSDS